MKNLFLVAAIALGSFTTFAQTADASVASSTVTKKEVVETKKVVENFTEIKPETLPDAVKTAIKTSLPEAKIVKAFVNEKKEYKVELIVNDKNATVYLDAEGKQLQK